MGLLLNLEVKQLNTLVFHFFIVSPVKYFGVDDAFSSETELRPLMSLLLSPLEQFGVINNSPGEEDEPAAAAAAAASDTGSIGFTVFTFFSTSAAVGFFTAIVSDTFDDVDTGGGGGVGDFSSFAATGVGGDCLSFTAAAATSGGGGVGDDDRFSIAACGPGDGGGDACFLSPAEVVSISTLAQECSCCYYRCYCCSSDVGTPTVVTTDADQTTAAAAVAAAPSAAVVSDPSPLLVVGGGLAILFTG